MIKLNKRDYKNPYTNYCYAKIYIKNRWKQQNVEENRGDLCISFFFFLKGGAVSFIIKILILYIFYQKKKRPSLTKGEDG